MRAAEDGIDVGGARGDGRPEWRCLHGLDMAADQRPHEGRMGDERARHADRHPRRLAAGGRLRQQTVGPAKARQGTTTTPAAPSAAQRPIASPTLRAVRSRKA
ncbi:MAG: hypothetical protein DMD79_14490 [Candidatus Rokuibacteriota bacterium]|nr:MAG: hypothetical protein DMD79_14490 [Candidatus Rokubacteria bacterium]